MFARQIFETQGTFKDLIFYLFGGLLTQAKTYGIYTFDDLLVGLVLEDHVDLSD